MNKFEKWIMTKPFTSKGMYIWGLINGAIATFMIMFILSVFMGVKFGL